MSRRACFATALAVVVAAAAALPGVTRAQESLFALQFLGVSEETGDVRARGMGVLGVGLADPRTGVSLNPATLGRLDQMTISAMGLAGVRTSRSDRFEEQEPLARFPHQRFALPLFGKVVFTTGFQGLRNFFGGYELPERSVDGFTYRQRFERDGSLFLVPVGIAGAWGRFVQAGITADFLLGTVDESWTTTGDSLVALASRRRDTLTGRTVNLGILLTPGAGVAFGVSWSPEFTADRSRRLTLEDSRLGARVSPLRDHAVRRDVTFPQVVRLGLSYAWRQRLVWSTDYQWREWEVYDGDAYEAPGFTNAWRWGTGLEWDPDGVGSYRIGFSRQRWPQLLGGVSGREIFENTLHLGFGIDMGQRGGRLDFAIERGWIGDLADNGREESTWRFVLGVSGQEVWRRHAPR